MSTFEKVRRGLEASRDQHEAGSNEEKRRWKSVFERVPPEQHNYATKLLSISKNGRCLTADQVVGAINAAAGKKEVAPAIEQGETALRADPGLYHEGMQAAARLTGKPIPSVQTGGADWGEHKPFVVDPKLFSAGAEEARRLLGKPLGNVSAI